MDVVETLERIAAEAGYPKTIRVDNRPEFISKKLDLWAFMKGVTLDFSRPDKPTDNAYAESFNATVRLECLSQNWFMDLDDAIQKVEEWRHEYNEVRPHSAIDDRPPMSLFLNPRLTAAAAKSPEILT